MVVGHFSESVQPQLAWLAVASLCLISWFSPSILEMVLRTASLAYPGQGTHSQELKEGVTKELGSLVHGYRGYNVRVSAWWTRRFSSLINRTFHSQQFDLS